MGREVKRVPLNFDWPSDKVWWGFQNPHYKPCPDCKAGSTVDSQWLGGIVRLLMLAGEDGKRGRFHPWLQAITINPGEPPTERMAELTTGLAGREPSLLGYDSLDTWMARKKILAAAGLPEDWGDCRTCNGEAIHTDAKEAYDAWVPTDPPAGDGWQLWETVSEGSPVSPVFATPEELARWMSEDPREARFGKSSYETCLRFVHVGWAPSMVFSEATGPISGVEAIGGEAS